MINVPDKVKTLFKSDNVKKNFRVTFPNGESPDITNDQVVYESVKLTESICSQNRFRFGLAESPVLEFEAVGIQNIKGCEINAYLELDYTDYIVRGSLWPSKIEQTTTQFLFEYRGKIAVEIVGDVDYVFYDVKDQTGRRIDSGSKNIVSDSDKFIFMDYGTSAIRYEFIAYNKRPGDRPAELLVYELRGDIVFDDCKWYYRIPYGNFIVNECKRTNVTYGRYKVLAYGKYGAGADHPFISPLMRYKLDYIRSASSFAANARMNLELLPEVDQDLNLVGRQDEYTYAETSLKSGECFINTDIEVVSKSGKSLGPLRLEVAFLKVGDYSEAKTTLYVEADRSVRYSIHQADAFKYKHIGDASGTYLEPPDLLGTFYYHFNGNLTDNAGAKIDTIKITNADSAYVYPRMFFFEDEADGYYDAEYKTGIPFEPIDYQLDVAPWDEYGAINTAIYVVKSFGYTADGQYRKIDDVFGDVKFLKVNIPDSYYKVWIDYDLTETKYNTDAGSMKTGYSPDIASSNVQNYPKIVSAYLELLAYVCKATRYNGTELINFATYPGLFPSITLYPAVDLYPEHIGERVNVAEYASLEWEDVKLKKIGRVVFNLQGDAATNYSIDTVDDYNEEDYYTYDMTDNYILANNNLAPVTAKISPKSIEENMLPNFIDHIAGAAFQNCTITMKGLPYLEIGDRLSVLTKDGDEVQLIIMRRTLSGINHLMDLIECK